MKNWMNDSLDSGNVMMGMVLVFFLLCMAALFAACAGEGDQPMTTASQPATFDARHSTDPPRNTPPTQTTDPAAPAAPAPVTPPEPDTPPPPPPPAEKWFQFHGNNAASVIAVGDIHYRPDQLPTRLNYGNMNNAVYTPTSWDFAIKSTVSGLPSESMTNQLAGQTAEWCIGICIFGSGPVAMLSLRDGHGFLLQYAFVLSGDTAAHPLPDISQLIAKAQCFYRNEPQLVPLVVLLQADVRELTMAEGGL
jgi:hypothetical protein